VGNKVKTVYLEAKKKMEETLRNATFSV